MEVASLEKYQPYLGSVFGALSERDTSEIRAIFKEVDRVLLDISGHFGRNRAGWEGTGLELTWSQSGQTGISSNVGASTKTGDCVDFCLELRPSWHFGEMSEVLTWDIETSIEADCKHTIDCAHMHTVDETVVRVETAIGSAKELLSAVRRLRSQAIDHPLEYWLELASDTAA